MVVGCICDKCGKNEGLYLTAIPDFGYDLCYDCLVEFVNEVIKPSKHKDTPMKIDPDTYEEIMCLLDIPERDWITHGIEDSRKVFWNGINCYVNRELYIKFFKKQ